MHVPDPCCWCRLRLLALLLEHPPACRQPLLTSPPLALSPCLSRHWCAATSEHLLSGKSGMMALHIVTKLVPA